jgi:hypothetical protein
MGSTDGWCHRPIHHVPLRASVTEASSFESYDNDNPFYLREFDTNRSVFSPREESWMLDPDLVEQSYEWGQAPGYFSV